MHKKKILYIVNSLSQGSGVMSFIMNLYRNVDRDKIQIDFIIGTKTEFNYENELLSLGANIYYIPVPKKISFKNYISFKRKIKNFFKENGYQYDIIHSHVPTFNFFYFPIAKKHGINYRIAHSHSTKSSGKFFNRIRNFFLLSRVRKSANIYFACTEKAGTYLFGEKNLENGKVKIVNNGINSEEFTFSQKTRAQTRKGLDIENQFVIGHVGRFASEKNHDFLLQIFCEIRRLREDSLLLLVGDGELINNIKEKAYELGIEKHVKFLGLRSDISEIMQAMDVFVLPSHFEGLGIVAIEAQSVGLPCFVSNGVPNDVNVTELVHHISLKETPSFWAKQICNYKINTQNRENFSKIIKDTHYGIEKIAEWLVDFYINLNE